MSVAEMPIQTAVLPGYVEVNVRDKAETVNYDRLRVLVYGEPGAGKSEFMASIPDCIHGDTELKADFVRRRHPTNHFVSWRDRESFERWRDYVVAEKEAGRSPYKYVAIDTVDGLLFNIWGPSLSPDGRLSISQYGDLMREMDKLTARLTRAGFGVVCGMHYKRKEYATDIGQPPRVVIEPAVPGGCEGVLNKWSIVRMKLVQTKEMRPVTYDLKVGDKTIQRTKDEKVIVVRATAERAPNEEVPFGGNLAMPDPLELPLGMGWETWLAALKKANA